MKCLVTGASGLIGSALLAAMDPDWDVHVIGRHRPSAWSGKWHRHDFTSGKLPGSLPDNIDVVVHLAQSEHFRDFPAQAVDVFRVNALSTVLLLDYARGAGARTFVLASSGGVYPPGQTALHEDLDIATRGDLGFYLGTKLCSEIVTEQYSQVLAVAILRFFFVYGPGQREDMLIPRLFRTVRNGEPIHLQGRDGLILNPIYIADAVRATLRAMQLTQSHKVNVGGPDTVSLRTLTETIGELIGAKPTFTVDESRQPAYLAGDISKMTRELAQPVTRLRDGLRLFLARQG